MKEAFKIYIDQLKDGHSEKIEEKFDPEFLDVKEEDLCFIDPVDVNGEAYLAEHELVLHLDIHTQATIPCAICNQEVKVPVDLKDFYHMVPTAEIKSAIYNFQEMLRENILLNTPLFAECSNGQCPERDELKRFFREVDSPDKNSKDEGYQPFADL
jgi:uncharacterized metal-binding protein YceD (DUF177 family)